MNEANVTSPNLAKLHSYFVEIVAASLHAFDQINKGVRPPDSVTAGWRERYRGTPPEDLPPYTVELNHFQNEVDSLVAMLVHAVKREHDERTSKTAK